MRSRFVGLTLGLSFLSVTTALLFFSERGSEGAVDRETLTSIRGGTFCYNGTLKMDCPPSGGQLWNACSDRACAIPPNPPLQPNWQCMEALRIVVQMPPAPMPQWDATCTSDLVGVTNCTPGPAEVCVGFPMCQLGGCVQNAAMVWMCQVGQGVQNSWVNPVTPTGDPCSQITFPIANSPRSDSWILGVAMANGVGHSVF